MLVEVGHLTEACERCGAALEEDAAFCERCGAPV
ncbi:MAG: zinc ribbon domain-containing protein, partial [Coriobacteriales bacterium]|nr:zinc ribbon domain-containing protein [Coriobacteriales bacterium]